FSWGSFKACPMNIYETRRFSFPLSGDSGQFEYGDTRAMATNASSISLTIDPEFQSPDFSYRPEFAALIPPLTGDHAALLRAGRLGFEGEKYDGRVLECVRLKPSTMGALYWMWSHI